MGGLFQSLYSSSYVPNQIQGGSHCQNMQDHTLTELGNEINILQKGRKILVDAIVLYVTNRGYLQENHN